MNFVDAGIGFLVGFMVLLAFDFLFYKRSKGSVGSSDFHQTIESLRSELEKAKQSDSLLTAANKRVLELENQLSSQAPTAGGVDPSVVQELQAKLSAAEAKLSEAAAAAPATEGTPEAEWQQRVKSLEALVTARENQIEELKSSVSQASTKSVNSEDYEEQIAALNAGLNAKEAKIQELMGHAAKASSAVPEELLEKVSALEAGIAAKDKKIQELMSQSAKAGAGAPEELLEKISAMEVGLAAKDAKIQELIAQHSNPPVVNDGAADRIKELEAEVADKETIQARLVAALQELEDLRSHPAAAHAPVEAPDQSRKIADKDAEITTLRGQLNEKEQEAGSLRRELENERVRIQVLMAAQETMQREAAQAAPAPVAAPAAPAPNMVEAIQKSAAKSAAAVAEIPKIATRAGRDPLERVDGIGPVYQAKLWEAGIHKFSDLAALTEERIIEIIQPKDWQHIDAEAWIREAKELAAGEK